MVGLPTEMENVEGNADWGGMVATVSSTWDLLHLLFPFILIAVSRSRAATQAGHVKLTLGNLN